MIDFLCLNSTISKLIRRSCNYDFDVTLPFLLLERQPRVDFIADVDFGLSRSLRNVKAVASLGLCLRNQQYGIRLGLSLYAYSVRPSSRLPAS